VAINAEQLLYRSPGGIGRYTAQLLTVLPQSFPDVEVVPLFARHSEAQIQAALDRAGVPPEVSARQVTLPWPRQLLWESWVRLGRPRLPALPGTDLAHAPSVAVPPRVTRVPRIPLVVTVHDAAPLLFPDAFTKRARRWHRTALQATARRADLVITVSQAAADEIVSHTPIAADRIRVVPNGVAAPEIDLDERRRLVRARGLEDREFVLWVGSLEPRKGVGTLVAAMAELKRRHPANDTLLVLAGFDGWLNADLIDPADRQALGPALRHLGRVSEPELWALYGAATVFAFPSRHEGFGLPVIEAMSQGVAVVASDIAAVREVAGGAARLVDTTDVKGWADALDELLDHPQERARLAEQGRARSRAFNVEEMAAATVAVYREVSR
jgi:glycosyltransferase involved in cell wall biosynthesis